MSFSLTTPQFLNRTKTVTRRLGWTFLKPGDLVMGVEKGMGLKRGEKVKRLGLIRIVDVNLEPLCCITKEDVRREGFTKPIHTIPYFIEMFCRANRCHARTEVTRIEFEYLETPNAED